MSDLKEFDQKILKYLESRKTAATIKQVAKFFIRSDSAVSKSLNSLAEQGFIKCIKAGGTKFYSVI